jgi:hypothetical protein
LENLLPWREIPKSWREIPKLGAKRQRQLALLTAFVLLKRQGGTSALPDQMGRELFNEETLQ